MHNLISQDRDYFHGIAISLIQHPSYVGDGVHQRHLVCGPEGGCSYTIDRLPEYYTEVPPASSIKVPQVPETKVKSLARDGVGQHTVTK